MKMSKIGIAFLIVPLLIAVAAYPFLPATIPIHFNTNGTTNTGSKNFVFLIAFIPFIAYIGYKAKYRR